MEIEIGASVLVMIIGTLQLKIASEGFKLKCRSQPVMLSPFAIDYTSQRLHICFEILKLME